MKAFSHMTLSELCEERDHFRNHLQRRPRPTLYVSHHILQVLNQIEDWIDVRKQQLHDWGIA